MSVATEKPDATATGAPVSYYAELADAFRHGQLSLHAAPKPELLALPDPYDPVRNLPYRRHDLSLYRGKYYVYWGVTPVLALYLPVYCLLHVYPSDASAVLLFLLAGTIFWLITLGASVAAWFPKLNPIWTLLGGLAVGFCSTGPFLLARPAVYEVCLAATYCFTAVAFCLIQRAMSSGPSRGNLIAAGTALILAVGCRPLILLAAVPILAGLWWRLRRETVTSGKALRGMVAFVIPLAAGGLLLAAYNYLRFDSPFQFGNEYALSGVNTREISLFAVIRVPRGLYYYLLSGRQIRPEFPFLLAYQMLPQPPAYVEGYAGMLASYPFLVSLLVLPLLLRRSEVKPEARMVIAILATMGVAELLLMCSCAGITIRYQVDFAPLLVMAAVLTICLAAASSRSWRHAVIVFAPLLILGAVQGCLLGFTGYHNSYDLRHPGSIAAIQAKLLPIENGLARWTGGYGGLRLMLQADTAAPGDSQVLATAAANEATSLVVMRYLDTGRAEFGCAMQGSAPIYGQPIEFQPHELHKLEIYTGAMYPESRAMYASWFSPDTYETSHDRCLVVADNEVVADVRPFPATTSAPWLVRAGSAGPTRIVSRERIPGPPPDFDGKERK